MKNYGGQTMTKETVDLIIEWFGHIQQMATDRKTQTGAVMEKQHCLDEIAAMASRCRQFVEEYKDEQEYINEEELDKIALESTVNFPILDTKMGIGEAYNKGFKAGCRYRKTKKIL